MSQVYAAAFAVLRPAAHPVRRAAGRRSRAPGTSGRSRRSSSATARPLLRAARRYLPEARAEDALQQAYIAAWSALQRGDEVRDLRAWLYRIVHNTALNQLRVSGYDYAELEESLLAFGAARRSSSAARWSARRSGLAGLPERQRDALLRIAIEGRRQEEVARELGVTEGAVRQLVHRARLTLRAAATAFIPLPLAEWAAAAGGSGAGPPTAERIAELIAGAGASAFAAKAGAVAVIATTTAAVAGPSIVSSDAEPSRPARTTAIGPRTEDAADRIAIPVPIRGDATPASTATPADVASSGRPQSVSRAREDARAPQRGPQTVQHGLRGRTRRARARRLRLVRSGSNSGSGLGLVGVGLVRLSGSSGSGSSGSGSSGSGSSGSGSSGSGSGPSGRRAPSGSGSSGSGSSGSGSSGSGSSGSGSSGSGSSGSSSPTPEPLRDGHPELVGSGSSGSGSSGLLRLGLFRVRLFRVRLGPRYDD